MLSLSNSCLIIIFLWVDVVDSVYTFGVVLSTQDYTLNRLDWGIHDVFN